MDPQVTADPPAPPDDLAGRGAIRVLVVDDQTLVREGLVTLLGLIEDLEVVGTAADGEQGIRLAQELQPDVVLMDLRMPRMDGVEATRRLLALEQPPHVLVLTTYADDESVLSALEAGALGYLIKDSSAEDIALAVRTVSAGKAVLEPQVQRRLLELKSGHDMPLARPEQPSLPDGLTQREADVLILIAHGLSNQEIAQRLFISEATVKTHINNLFSKAGLRDRAQAVMYAYRHGLAR
jgi:DNA-binding NarL/FixJ family response regulator